MKSYDASIALIRAARFTIPEAGLIALGSVIVLGILSLGISGFIDSIVVSPAGFAATVFLYIMYAALVVALVTIFASAEKSACSDKTLRHHFGWTLGLNFLAIVIWAAVNSYP